MHIYIIQIQPCQLKSIASNPQDHPKQEKTRSTYNQHLQPSNHILNLLRQPRKDGLCLLNSLLLHPPHLVRHTHEDQRNAHKVSSKALNSQKKQGINETQLSEDQDNRLKSVSMMQAKQTPTHQLKHFKPSCSFPKRTPTHTAPHNTITYQSPSQETGYGTGREPNA